jgi:hypothetical protein
VFGLVSSILPLNVFAAPLQSAVWTQIDVHDSLGECDGIEVADVDHDDLNEMIYYGYNEPMPHTLKCFEYNGGTWTNYDILDPPVGWEMDTGDVDNDGNIEIAVGGWFAAENKVRVYKYNASGWFEFNVTDLQDAPGNVNVRHVVIGDLDNDSDNELAIGLEDHGTTDHGLRYYEYNASRWDEYRIADYDSNVEVVEIGDVDNDGLNELLVGITPDESTPQNVSAIRYYEYNSGSWDEFSIAEFQDMYIGMRSLKIGDINNDGDNEVVAGIGGLAGQVAVHYYQYEAGNWIEHSLPLGVLGSIQALEIGDVDDDGDNEVVIGLIPYVPGQTTPAAQLLYFKHIGGIWQLHMISAGCVFVSDIVIGDIDNDGVTEVAMGEGLATEGYELKYFEFQEYVPAPPINIPLIALVVGIIVIIIVISVIVYLQRRP